MQTPHVFYCLWHSFIFQLIENRHVVDWDAILPGNGGLLIYHIDEDMLYQDRPGFPDGPYWPHDHYVVALLQADGNYDLERGNNNGDAGDFFTANTPPLLPGGKGNFPNSDSYQFGTLVRCSCLLKVPFCDAHPSHSLNISFTHFPLRPGTDGD